MPEKPRILCVGQPSKGDGDFVNRLGEFYEVVDAPTALRALARLTHEDFSGIYVFSEGLRDGLQLARLAQSERILEGMPDGVALLDAGNCIVWANAEGAARLSDVGTVRSPAASRDDRRIAERNHA